MKRQLTTILGLFLLAILLTNCNSSKSYQREFEGVVIYSLNISSKTPGVDSRELQRNFGNEMVYTYKDGNYKMEFNGPDSPTIYYISKDNHQYTLFPSTDTLWQTDCSIESSKLLSFVRLKKKEQILNATCDVIESGLEGDLKYTYIFDPNRYINPDYFAEHRLGYVNKFYENAKGLILQYKREGISFDLTQTAIKVEEKDINPSVFTLPDLPRKSMDTGDY